jgi:hypothetical protein
LLIFLLVFDALREEITLGQLLIQVGNVVWSFTIIIPTVVGIYVAGSIKEKVPFAPQNLSPPLSMRINFFPSPFRHI